MQWMAAQVRGNLDGFMRSQVALNGVQSQNSAIQVKCKSNVLRFVCDLMITHRGHNGSAWIQGEISAIGIRTIREQ